MPAEIHLPAGYTSDVGVKYQQIRSTIAHCFYQNTETSCRLNFSNREERGDWIKPCTRSGDKRLS